jgi:hypothetical protein
MRKLALQQPNGVTRERALVMRDPSPVDKWQEICCGADDHRDAEKAPDPSGVLDA